MCTTCGCSSGSRPRVHGHEHEHEHEAADEYSHSHGHAHSHADGEGARIVRLEEQILAKNDRAAARNRGFFEGRRIAALNLMGSPGAGKATLLERLLGGPSAAGRSYVVEGDQATDHDAARIRATGCPVVQINTGTGCHLEAEAVARAVRELDPAPGGILWIENVGNLVCPALFDLGERARVLLSSVAEGDDKPEKYPHMFHDCDALVISKIDLLPHLSFDLARFRERALRIQPKLRVFEVSATRGEGLAELLAWLDEQRLAAGSRDEAGC